MLTLGLLTMLLSQVFIYMLKLLCISIHIPNFSLDFQNFNFSTVNTVKRVNCITMQNFVEIALTAAEIW